MEGYVFECCECEHRFNAGITRLEITDVLPEATLFQAGDKKGVWVEFEGDLYCTECAKTKLPQLFEDGVAFKFNGEICF